MPHDVDSGGGGDGARPAVPSSCPRCEPGDHTRGPRADGLRHRVAVAWPSVDQLEEWLSEGGAEATDGCWVEPDGTCPHGHSSWLRALGLI